MGISVKVLQYLPQGFDFLLGWTFFPPDQKKGLKFLRKGNFSTRRHAKGALRSIPLHAWRAISNTLANMFYKSTDSLVGRASDSPRACVVSLGHFIPIALILIKPRKPFSFSRHGVDYCCFKMTENLFTGP